MNIRESIFMAWTGISGNKLRSVLTMLGVIIGVAAVIALVSIGQGATTSVSAQVKGLGSNLIIISARAGGQAELFLDDCAMLLERVPTIGRAVPSVSSSVTVKWYNQSLERVSLEGTTADYEEVRNHTLASGRFIDAMDVASLRKVAVVGQTVVNDLIFAREPIGEKIMIEGQTFTVIGVMSAKGSTMGQDQDNLILIPVTAAQRLLGTSRINTIYAQARNEAVASLAVTHSTAVFDKHFSREDAVNVQSQDQLLSTIDSMTATLTAMLAAIAGISLLVGGIGIMNIMLVSVTERTREIGIRKAFGAKRRDILLQFLVEAVIISTTGGIIGSLAGIGAARVVSRLAGWSTIVSPSAVLTAFGFAAGVGLFFGVYPAVKAAGLDPIEALRYE